MRDELIKFLESLNNDVNRTLLRTDIPQYVDKILSFATLSTIYENEELKAFIAFYDNDQNKELAYLTMIAVSKPCWHLGYGKKLLESSIKEVINKGFKRYRLQVKKDNLNAIRLYKNFGFKIVEEDEHMFNMEKEL